MANKWIKEELIRLLGHYNVTGNEHDFDCPFCHQGHLHVNFDKGDKGVGICHKCGFGTRNLFYLIKVLGGSLKSKEVGLQLNLKNLKKKLEQVFTHKSLYREQEEEMELPPEFEILSIPPKDAYAKIMFAYLIKWRGLTIADIVKLKVGFCRRGRFRGMLVFPIYMHNKLIYFTTRGVLGQGTKNLNPELATRDYVLAGIDLLASDHLYVVEGILDTLAFEGGGVAVLGHSLSLSQARLLDSLNVREITVAYDSDVDNRTIVSACKLLAANTRASVSFMVLENGDPFDNRDNIDFWIERRVQFTPLTYFRNEVKHILNKKEKPHANRRDKSKKLFNV